MHFCEVVAANNPSVILDQSLQSDQNYAKPFGLAGVRGRDGGELCTVKGSYLIGFPFHLKKS